MENRPPEVPWPGGETGDRLGRTGSVYVLKVGLVGDWSGGKEIRVGDMGEVILTEGKGVTVGLTAEGKGVADGNGTEGRGAGRDAGFGAGREGIAGRGLDVDKIGVERPARSSEVSALCDWDRDGVGLDMEDSAREAADEPPNKLLD